MTTHRKRLFSGRGGGRGGATSVAEDKILRGSMNLSFLVYVNLGNVHA